MKFLAISLALPVTCSLAAPPAGSSAPPTVTFVQAASAPLKASCDCTSYPFKPNPPCFGLCVARFAETKNPDLLAVRGLDPGVAVSLRVLAASPSGTTFEYSKLTSKAELEKAAQKASMGHELKFEPMRQLKYQR